MGEPYLVVWDLDGTLGDFEALERPGAPDAAIRLWVRPGLADALDALCRAGFTHSLLTTASPLYAEVALRGAGLRHLFARVEGRGQRYKGDAAGVADAFGIPTADRAHRVLFASDRLDFDEPDDPDVVFHLECCALARPADQFVRLVEHLREAGGGSLREGFRRTGRGPRQWRRLLRRPTQPVGQPVQRSVVGVGALLLLERAGACPVIAFAGPPDEPAAPSEHEVFPARVAIEVETSRAAAGEG